MACRIARNREWAARLLHEKSQHKSSVFLTLTFNPDSIPPLDSLSKDTLQKFLKRLRKGLNGRKIKYFACGEYGELHGHAHYHLIVFGLSLSLKDKALVEKVWSNPDTGASYGYVYFGTVTYSSCRYVTAYILKKITGKMAAEEYGDRVPPFALMSKGLGKSFIMKNKAQFDFQQGMTIDGKHFPLPRYYTNLMTWQDTPDGLVQRSFLDIDKQAIIEKAIANAKDKLASYEQRGLIDPSDRAYSIEQARKQEDQQRASNILAKQNLSNSKKL